MIMNRYGEEGYPPFRTKRLFSGNGEWYFDTREGTQQGPYSDLEDAKKALALFIAQRLQITENNRHDESSDTPGSQDGIEQMVEELVNYLYEYRIKGQTPAMAWASQRLHKLLKDKKVSADRSKRMEALQFALDQEI